MNVFSKLVRSMAVAASVNGACWLISSAVRTRRPGLVITALTTRPRSCASSRAVAEVARTPSGEPHRARHVRVVEVERLERARPDALDVPRVEELVRHGIEQIEPAAT